MDNAAVQVVKEGKSRKRKPQAEIFCHLCATYCNGQATYNLHLAGQKHRKKESLAKSVEANVEQFQQTEKEDTCLSFATEDVDFLSQQKNFKQEFNKSLVIKEGNVENVENQHQSGDQHSNQSTYQSFDQPINQFITQPINQSTIESTMEPTKKPAKKAAKKARKEATKAASALNKDVFYCDLCNLNVACLAHLQSHFNGTKHTKRAKSRTLFETIMKEAKGEGGTSDSHGDGLSNNNNGGMGDNIENNNSNNMEVVDGDTDKDADGSGKPVCDYSKLVGSEFIKESEGLKGAFTCELCEMSPLSYATLLTHLNGRKHKLKYRVKFDLSIPLSPGQLKKIEKQKEMRKRKKESKEQFWKEKLMQLDQETPHLQQTDQQLSEQQYQQQDQQHDLQSEQPMSEEEKANSVHHGQQQSDTEIQ